MNVVRWLKITTLAVVYPNTVAKMAEQNLALMLTQLTVLVFMFSVVYYAVKGVPSHLLPKGQLTFGRFNKAGM